MVCHFMVHMDNRAFTFLHNVKPLTGRLTRWTDYLLQYNFPVITYQDRQMLKPNHSLDKFGKKKDISSDIPASDFWRRGRVVNPA